MRPTKKLPVAPPAVEGPLPGAKLPARKPRRSATPAATLRRERRRVAQTLHDTVCQDLTGICLLATVAARRYRVTCPEAEEHLREIAGLIQRAGADMANFVHGLRGKP